LKLARKLETARFSREQAEAIAEAFADATTGTLASKADLELSTNTLRSELQARTDVLQAEIKTTADAPPRCERSRLPCAKPWRPSTGGSSPPSQPCCGSI
jgi:hypothetical protein